MIRTRLRTLTLLGGLLTSQASLGDNKAPSSPSPTLEIEAAPIQIMAVPPEEDYGDEFALPADASKALIAKRNQIDTVQANLLKLAEKIDAIVQSASMDDDVKVMISKLKALKSARQAFQAEKMKLRQYQEDFRIQLVDDDDAKFQNLEDGPTISDQEMAELN